MNYINCSQDSRKSGDRKLWELCTLYREDYFECLHHRKEHEHHRRIKERYFELKRKGELPEELSAEIIPDYRYFKVD